MSYNKSYYEKNKKTILKRRKVYRKNNLENMKDYQRLWYQKNRYHIKCTICRSKYLQHNKTQHFKTQKHQRALHGARPKNKRTKNKKEQVIKEQDIEEQKIIPYKTIFVGRGIIKWSSD